MNDDRLRIHLIDDDSSELIRLFDALSRAGFEVSASSRAQEALAFVSRYHPRVVLCDLELPEISGFEMLGRIRKVSPETKVFLMSRWTNEELLEQVVRLGGLKVLLTPCSAEEVAGELDRLVHAAM